MKKSAAQLCWTEKRGCRVPREDGENEEEDQDGSSESSGAED